MAVNIFLPSGFRMTLDELARLAAFHDHPPIIVLSGQEWQTLLRLIIGMESPRAEWDAAGAKVRVGTTEFRPRAPDVVDLSGRCIFAGSAELP